LAFESLKEQLKDQWADLSSKIQENSAFSNAREKFEAQSPTIQKAIIGAVVALIAIFMLSFPWSYISESQDHMADFEDDRGLIQGLLRASRAAKEPSPLPAPAPVDMLRARVDSIVREQRLMPEQVGEITPLPANPSKDMAPPVVVQTGLAVQLKKLNLEQVTVLAHEFQMMGPGTKLMGMDILQTAGESHYYDLIVRVVNFALPAMNLQEEPESNGKKGGKGPAKKPRKSDEESAE
jgi:hypothetical protein